MRSHHPAQWPYSYSTSNLLNELLNFSLFTGPLRGKSAACPACTAAASTSQCLVAGTAESTRQGRCFQCHFWSQIVLPKSKLNIELYMFYCTQLAYQSGQDNWPESVLICIFTPKCKKIAQICTHIFKTFFGSYISGPHDWGGAFYPSRPLPSACIDRPILSELPRRFWRHLQNVMT